MTIVQTRPVPTYPIVLTNLGQVRCVVVGGGAVAERKVGDLLEGGARPEVVSPTLTPRLLEWREAGCITHIAHDYEPADQTGAFLLIAATDDRAVNAAIAADGEHQGTLVNVADDPEAGNFHTVGAVRQGDLLLTVSTGGASPALAAYIRRELAARYSEEYARLLNLLRQFRAGPADELAPAQRTHLWRRLRFDTLLDWLRADANERAQEYLEEQAAEARRTTSDKRQEPEERQKTRVSTDR